MPAKVSPVTQSNHRECCPFCASFPFGQQEGLCLPASCVSVAEGYVYLKRDLAEIRIKGLQL